MSGCSTSGVCPNCGNPTQVYTDWKPFDMTDTQCYHCGFIAYTKVDYLSLDELNELREEINDEGDYPPLNELPIQEYEF